MRRMSAEILNQVFIAFVYTAFAAGSGALGWVFARMFYLQDRARSKNASQDQVLAALQAVLDRLEPKHERTEERQADTREEMRELRTRIAATEATNEKIAEALDRLTRLEEWRDIAAPQLSDAKKDQAAIATLDERMRTAFRLIDGLAAQIGAMSEKVENMPARAAAATVAALQPYMRRG